MRKAPVLLFPALLVLVLFHRPTRSSHDIDVSPKTGDQFADALREAARKKRSGLPAEAVVAYSALLLEARTTGEEKLESDCLIALGALAWDGGDIDGSVNYYARALRLAERNIWNETQVVCRTAQDIRDLYQAGKKHRDGRRYDRSVECFRKAVELARKIGSPGHEAKCLRQMGVTYYMETKLDEFYSANRKAYQVSKRNNLVRERANCVFNLAFYHLKTRAFYDAYIEFNEARGLYRCLGASDDEAECLHNIALIYHDMGSYDQALSGLRAILRQTKNDELKAAVLISMGNTLRRLALPEKDRAGLAEAAQSYRRALDLAIRNKNAFQETVALNNLGYHYYQLKDFRLALMYFTMSLEAGKDLPDLGLKCAVRANIGNACLDLGKIDLAEKHFTTAALRLNREKHPGVLWEVFFGLGRCCQLGGEPGRAYSFFVQSMSMIEEAAKNTVFDYGRSDYLQDKHSVFEEVMKSLIDGRRYEDLEPGTVLKLVSLIEAGRLQTLRENMRRKDDPDEKGRMSGWSWTGENVGGFLAGAGMERLKSRLKAGNTAVLMYFLGDSLSFAILLRGSSAVCRGLFPADKLGAEVDRYVRLLSSPPEGEFQGRSAAEALWKDVFAPDHQRHLEGVRNLVIIPHGKLCFLPFESLISGDGVTDEPRYLIERQEITYAPTLVSWLALSDSTAPCGSAARILLVGKRSYDEYLPPGGNEYLISMRRIQSQAGMSFPPLPGVLKEARKITARMGRENSVLWLDESAGEDAVKDEDLQPYRIIHFACHGLADESSAGRSALALTRTKGSREDGYLQVSEILNLKLSAELVVLSACRTGRGRLSRGEGVMGLTKAFLHAGARSVLSSLWNIHDGSTADFMDTFYAHLSRGASKGAALRLAKLRMIRSRYSHPYFWAPFVLSGDFASSF